MRKAFSMIELIVSIVILGITLMTVPTLLSQTAYNNESALIQESVMDAKTRMAVVLRAPWGCYNNNADYIANITSSRSPIFGNKADFYTRNGLPNNRLDRRRVFYNGNDGGANCAPAGGENLDTYIGQINAPRAPVIDATGEFAYTRDSIINTTIATGVVTGDMSGNANADIKEVTITVTTANTSAKAADGSHQIALRAYSANIGDRPDIQTKAW